MKKRWNHAQLKDQENSPEKENEIDLFSLIDNNFKKETMKTLKEIRENPNKQNKKGKRRHKTSITQV